MTGSKTFRPSASPPMLVVAAVLLALRSCATTTSAAAFSPSASLRFSLSPSAAAEIASLKRRERRKKSSLHATVAAPAPEGCLRRGCCQSSRRSLLHRCPQAGTPSSVMLLSKICSDDAGQGPTTEDEETSMAIAAEPRRRTFLLSSMIPLASGVGSVFSAPSSVEGEMANE